MDCWSLGSPNVASVMSGSGLKVTPGSLHAHSSPSEFRACFSAAVALEAPPIGYGWRQGRPSQRYRTQPSRMSLLTMMTTSEKATQKSITLPSLSVHHTSFL